MNQRQSILSDVDIEALLKSPKDLKIDIIKKIGKYYTSRSFSDEQMEAAEKIISTIVKHESDNHVRQTMSESIKNSVDIPNEIVMHLAEDITIVAIPILEFSKVLTDENLVYIIQRTDEVEKEESISRREAISTVVSNALIDKKHQSVIVTLLRNKGAEVSSGGFEKIINCFGDVQIVMEDIIHRPKVPIQIVQTASKKVTHIYEDDESLFQDTEMEFSKFIKLAREKGIRKEIIPIYALCIGNFNLFELCVAREICIPMVNIKKLMESDNNGDKFDIIYERAELPESLHEASRVLYLVLRDFTEEFDKDKAYIHEHDAERVINNIKLFSEEKGKVQNVDYIISMIKSSIN
jgi:hypothetical protein